MHDVEIVRFSIKPKSGLSLYCIMANTRLSPAIIPIGPLPNMEGLNPRISTWTDLLCVVR